MAVGGSLQISESSPNFSEDLSEISENFSSSDKMSSNFSQTIFTRGVLERLFQSRIRHVDDSLNRNMVMS